jgi:flagellar hook protein FlgE
MPSFSIPLSGLDTSSTDLSTIANNLANLNTVGFKGQTVQFQDLFYQQIGTSGDGDAVQVGVGSSVAGISSNLTQGSIETTGVSTDVAVQGNGYFVLNNNGETLYTRAGDFSTNSNGNLVTQDGSEVQGYQAVNGVIPPNATLGALSIPTGMINPPKATTQVGLGLNLDASGGSGTVAASQQTGQGIGAASNLDQNTTLTLTDGNTANPYTYTYTVPGTTNTLSDVVTDINTNSGGHFTASLSANGNLVITAADGKAITVGGNLSTGAGATKETFSPTGINTAPGTFSTSMVVYDALGTSHVLTFNFTKTAANTWTYQITIPTSDLAPGGNPVVSSGTLTFNGNGQLVSPATDIAGLTISNLADGATPMTFTWNLYNPTGGGLVTQMAGSSNASSTQQDGYASGSLQSFTIGSDGVIQGIFSNGQTNALGQIALATFSNEQGLIRDGSNEYVASLASGEPNVGDPGTGGRGTLSGGSLEQSNVDIATQFAQLILAERDYQANAKSLTTFDQVTQTAINLVQ